MPKNLRLRTFLSVPERDTEVSVMPFGFSSFVTLDWGALLVAEDCDSFCDWEAVSGTLAVPFPFHVPDRFGAIKPFGVLANSSCRRRSMGVSTSVSVLTCVM